MSDPKPFPSNTNPWRFGTQEVVLSAIFSALVVVLQITGIGSIPLANLSGAMTTLLIPVILGAIIGGPIVGMIAGTVMGVVYLMLPLTASFGPITLIVPRLAMALVAWAVYKCLRKWHTRLSSAAAGVAGAITNTVTAVSIAMLLGQVPRSMEIVYAILPQAAIEMIACAFLVPICVSAVDVAKKARNLQ